MVIAGFIALEAVNGSEALDGCEAFIRILLNKNTAVIFLLIYFCIFF